MKEYKDWKEKANETWIKSFLSCNHKPEDSCICESRRQELTRHIDQIISERDKEWAEKIFGMTLLVGGGTERDSVSKALGYNKAIEDVINLLQNK